MQTFPIIKKGQDYFTVHQSVWVHFAECSTTVPCLETVYVMKPSEMSLYGPSSHVISELCLWIAHVEAAWAPPDPTAVSVISQILMKRANSLHLSATHSQDGSTLDTSNGLLRFSTFISTQQGMVPCKHLLIIIYYNFKTMETCWNAPASNTWTLILPQT